MYWNIVVQKIFSASRANQTIYHNIIDFNFRLLRKQYGNDGIVDARRDVEAIESISIWCFYFSCLLSKMFELVTVVTYISSRAGHTAQESLTPPQKYVFEHNNIFERQPRQSWVLGWMLFFFTDIAFTMLWEELNVSEWFRTWIFYERDCEMASSRFRVLFSSNLWRISLNNN